MPTVKRRFNSEVFVSISALIVSVCALVVTIRQTIIAQAQLNGSVWPNLLISNQTPNNEAYTLLMTNQGIGPAIIHKIEVVHQGVAYADPLSLTQKNLLSVEYAGITPGRVVKAGEEVRLIVCQQDSVLAKKLGYLFRRDQTVIKLIYSDVYGNCWESDGLRYKPVDDCPPIEEMKID